MSIKHVQFALDGVPGLNAGQRLALVSLGEWANDEGVCWPSHDTIAKRVGVGRRQVIRIIEQLETMGVVERIERKQHSNKYRIRCDIAMSHQDVTPVAHVTSTSDVTLGAPDVTSATADVTLGAFRCDIHATQNRKEPPIRTTTKNHQGEARAKRATQVPDDFEPTTEQVFWAIHEVGLSSGTEVGIETLKFKDYHRAKGSTMKDWTAAWRNWMRNSVTFSKPKSSNGKASPVKLSNYEISAANIDAAGEPDDPFGITGPIYETSGRIQR